MHSKEISHLTLSQGQCNGLSIFKIDIHVYIYGKFKRPWTAFAQKSMKYKCQSKSQVYGKNLRLFSHNANINVKVFVGIRTTQDTDNTDLSINSWSLKTN